MCMQDESLRPYASGALYHHEALNGTGYPKGLTRKDIPIEGQIIRVADEFDAIVSKRQYKSHIGITDTLKMLIAETRYVPKVVALKSIEENTKLGRLNPKIVRTLFKVVIEDIEYEISGIFDYSKYLRTQIERLEKINSYNIKMSKTKRQSKKDYFTECMKLLFREGEDFKNYKFVLEDYRTALFKRKEIINRLYDEIKEIKKLRC